MTAIADLTMLAADLVHFEVCGRVHVDVHQLEAHHYMCAASADSPRYTAGSQKTDRELVEWMRVALAPPSMWRRPLLDLTLSHPYIPELGFSVAVDGAARLGRALPAMALTSVHPPGAFYQDHPMSDDVKVRPILTEFP